MMIDVIFEKIRFNDIEARVYYDGNTDEPIFKFEELGYPIKTLEQLEHDEYFRLGKDMFVTELGLYNLLSHDDSESGRLWRRVVHEQLIEIRKKHNKSVIDQFNEWDEMAGEYYFDENTGRMMRNVTVNGGDVIQIPA